MILEIGATRMLVCPADGASIGAGNAIDLIGDEMGHQEKGIALPVARPVAAFFRLSTGTQGRFVIDQERFPAKVHKKAA